MKLRLAALVTALLACSKATPQSEPVIAVPVGPPPPPVGSVAVAEDAGPPIVAKAKITNFEVGLGYACGVLDDGRAVCWDEANGAKEGPTVIAGVPVVDRVGVGNNFACARAVADKTLWCWGDNHNAQLGQRKASRGSQPAAAAQVLGDDGKPWPVEDFAVGGSHVCVLSAGEAGIVHCWGSSLDGESGIPPKQVNNEWVSVVAPKVVYRGAKRVFAGSEASCALSTKDELYCWGSQDAGYNGHGSTSSPKKVAVPGKVKSISFGSGSSCLLLEDGTVMCRGWNPGGELGSGGNPQHPMDGKGAHDSDFKATFTAIPELSDKYLDVAASRHETCAVTQAHELVCIGTGSWLDFSRLRNPNNCVVTRESTPTGRGAGTSAPPPPAPPTCIPRPHPDFSNVTHVSTTMGRRCALDTSGVVRCIGYRGRFGSKDIAEHPYELPAP